MSQPTPAFYLKSLNAQHECDEDTTWHTLSTIAENAGFAFQNVADLSMLEINQANAEATNELADAAYDKGCLDLSKKTYLGVINRYIGSGYEAMRQHAMIKIDDIRDAERKGGGGDLPQLLGTPHPLSAAISVAPMRSSQPGMRRSP